MKITYEEIRKNEDINAYIGKGNENLGVIGYTDHSAAHTALVGKRAYDILKALGYNEEECVLARIAGYMHDMGNAVNRKNHAEYGAILADRILTGMGMDLNDKITVVSAIGNHDESTGGAVDAVSAALIIADKTDVRRNRVRGQEKASFDIHDRVNHAVTGNRLETDKENGTISLYLDVDENICTMYEYFDIFLQRMLMSKRAAEFLGCRFVLMVNGVKIL